jgi:AcrR family transcriptional regulator
VTETAGDVIWMRPRPSATGRPPRHSQAEITAVAVAIADAEGLDAVSMRRVAAELGTGAASLYRYVDNREDLLDLMADSIGAGYAFGEPTGDWLADLLALGEQTRGLLRRHPWMPSLVLTRPVLGPHGLVLLERVLELLARHPADVTAKLEAFAMFNTVTASFVLNELAGGEDRQRRAAAYLGHTLAAGEHPRLAELLSQPPQSGLPGEPPEPSAAPADRYRDILAKILTGLLPAPSGA